MFPEVENQSDKFYYPYGILSIIEASSENCPQKIRKKADRR